MVFLFSLITLLGCGGAAANQESTSAATTETPAATESPAPAESPATADTQASTGSEAPASAPAAAPMPEMPASLPAPARAWERLSAQERGRHMHENVTPAMNTLFHAYDPEHFAEVTCATCHGENARQTHFHMPNPSLPVLPRFGTPAWEQMASQHGRMLEFMGSRVTPAMAQLLGKQPYDPATHQGFGCAGCHTMAAE